MPPTQPLLDLPFLAELTALRRDIHAHPELAFDENRTADIVARELERYGLEVHRGIAKTGVVGVLRAGTSSRMIGLRADMDALPLCELNEFPHHSKHQGKMHACGHDGHTAMLLGAARHLSSQRDQIGIDGTVYFIFQPAEEAEGGAAVMIEEKDLTGEKLWETVNTILSEPGRAEEIGKNAKAMAVLDANDRIYNIICEKAKK